MLERGDASSLESSLEASPARAAGRRPAIRRVWPGGDHVTVYIGTFAHKQSSAIRTGRGGWGGGGGGRQGRWQQGEEGGLLSENHLHTIAHNADFLRQERTISMNLLRPQ